MKDEIKEKFKEKHKKEIEEINNQYEELMKDESIKEIMTDEIKEMLCFLGKDNRVDEQFFKALRKDECQKLLDYITALEEENKELKLLSMTQNNREYRSKFLKEYQKEHGENCYPDYDEIYKRYDKLKEENEKIRKMNKAKHKYAMNMEDNYINERYKNKKAIEIYENSSSIKYKKRFMEGKTTADLMYEALQGDDNNAKD